MIYTSFKQWVKGRVLEIGQPRKKFYTQEDFDLIEMGWGYGYDAGVQWQKSQTALDKKAENARELGLDYEPVPVTMDDAIAAGNGVLMNEQSALLRECRAALDSLIQQKPTLAGLLCGSTTLGNLKASLYDYRPQGVFGTTPPAAPVQEPFAFANPDDLCADTAFRWCKIDEFTMPVYTTPPATQRQWVGLTTADLDEIDAPIRERGSATIAEIYRAIEAKLREKNGGAA